MYTTLEMRWFYPGTVPAAVESWFLHDCPGEFLGTPDNREDIYLYTTPTCEFINVKLRQGRIEVKWRKTELGTLQLQDNWEGKVEKWVKWICQDTDSDSITPAAVVAHQAWVSIQKSRKQRIYRIETDSATLTPIPQPADDCFAVEVTKLNLQGNDWWSLAFEIYGDDLTILEPAVRKVCRNYPDIPLQSENSFAYPTWLSAEFKR